MTVTLESARATTPSVTHRRHPTSPFVGVGRLLRLALRRDRLRIVLWVAGLVGLVLVTVQSITGLYTTQADLEQYARIVEGNTALIVQAGPGYGLDNPTLGAVIMNELAVWMIIAVALMNIFVVVRHTRTEETTENAELTRAAPVGRYAGTAAALLCALVSTIAVAVGVTLVLLLNDLPAVGSMAFGSALLGAGMTFATLTAAMAQIAATPRSALALSGVVLVASFVARAIGDVGDGRLSWISPIGWAQAIRAYADERWWTLLLPVGASCVFVGTAIGLQAHRDFGAGLLTERPGPPRAPDSLRDPLGLSVRLQRASIVAWSVGLGLLGFFYGIVAEQAESIFEDNPELESYFAHLGDASVTEAFLATSILMMSLLMMGFSVSSVLRLRTEETESRADQVLALPVSRTRWAGTHLATTVGGTTIAATSSGLAMGAGFAMMTGETDEITQMGLAGLLMVPALLVVASLTFSLVAWWPRRSMLAWGAVAAIAVIDLFGAVLELPRWVLNLSPFQHVPALPAEPFSTFPIVALVGCAALLTGAGMLGLRRRDIG